MNRRRPDIPLLVVEARGTSDAVAKLPVDLSGLTNLHRMADAPDPHNFYRVSRVVLMPSLWRESLGRVPIEAMANGIPVLASDHSTLPETLGNAGFVFKIPEHLHGPFDPKKRSDGARSGTLGGRIEKLWDDPELEARQRKLAREESRRWEPGRVADQFEGFFGKDSPTQT